MKKDEKIIRIVRIFKEKIYGLEPVGISIIERDRELLKLLIYLRDTYVDQIDEVKEFDKEVKQKGLNSEILARRITLKNNIALELLYATGLV